MRGQTSIPVPAATPAPRVCRWCGAPATQELVIEKERYRNHNGTRVVARAAVTAPVCEQHYKSIERTGLDG